MAIVESLDPSECGRRRLGLKSPVDGRNVGDITVSNAEDVAEALVRARHAQKSWAARGVSERARIVRRGLDVLLRRQEEIIAVIQRETGKTRVDALTIEIIAGCDFINHWCGRASKDLEDEAPTLHGYMRPLKKLRVFYEPLGVVGVITPWNGPFILSLDPCVQALLAGNAVLLKPSEVTPYSGGLVVEILHEAGVPRDAIQVLHGDGETGAALCSAGVDKVAFTGSVRTGKKVAAACAEQLIGCSLELGGNDPMIVCADANIERAVEGAAFLGLLNAGQVCLSVERIYVVESVAEEFLRRLKRKVGEVRVGSETTSDVGAIIWDRQLDTIERHLADAVERGATVEVGGKRRPGPGQFFEPTLLSGVTHEMAVMKEETFGPVLAVMVVRNEAEAIERANDSDYGLSASVFTVDEEKALRIARKLRAGSVMMNDAAAVYGVPEAPFGGVKNSGLGQVHGGSRALRGFCHAKPVVLDRFKLDREDVWFPITERTIKTLEKTISIAFSRPLRRLMR